MRAFEFAAGRPWAIPQKNLKLILDIAQRANQPDVQAVALRPPDSEPAPLMELRGDVAVINIIGPVFRYANLFTNIRGATSVQELAASFGKALADPSVKAIVLNIDSPGGEVDGISELATAVYAARDTKPVIAYVDGQAASGAYWIASAANRIITTDTGRLGSIGVIATVVEPGPEPGVKTYEFVSSVSPRKKPDLETEQGRADIQALVDDVGQIFVSTVARNRGVSVERVLSDFGQGSLVVASKAVERGMADALGTFEETLASLAAMHQTSPFRADSRGWKGENKLSAVAATEIQKPEAPLPNTDPAAAEAVPQEQAKEAPPEFPAETQASAALETAAQIAEICVLAGQPARIAEFIRCRTSLAEVRSALLKARAQQDFATEIRSAVLPETSADATRASINDSPIVKACEQLDIQAGKENK